MTILYYPGKINRETWNPVDDWLSSCAGEAMAEWINALRLYLVIPEFHLIQFGARGGIVAVFVL